MVFRLLINYNLCGVGSNCAYFGRNDKRIVLCFLCAFFGRKMLNCQKRSKNYNLYCVLVRQTVHILDGTINAFCFQLKTEHSDLKNEYIWRKKIIDS